ncbi:heavy metal translocating P-type ATPase metal-binding domain-containing protein [Flavihumibacter rivuli]|uniref:heavy metal translocating P-type ATPase n=1 Tax=Flavihumibacter rivuli TaxID=2838156 RepID=UPI001BDF633F|nr:heavy metal translocating P-type ATPase metal-binding domain-containing protein [Flavihumibacter rivuli]ULQ58404.1 heavy metal translocating P-type ATPase metal-binding domain-containing protein [Flavihumibacter rivuli]
MPTVVNRQTKCYHCGEDCEEGKIVLAEKQFCCEGCKTVFQILNENGLCDYYDLNNNPGQSLRVQVRKDKFSFLDDEKIIGQLIQFRNEGQIHITLYLPHIHCSSCLYLLEHLNKINPGVIKTTVNFTRKELSVIFDHKKISLRQLAELLTSIGYEPYISLNNLGGKKPRVPRTLIYQLGVAGFCFANIMLLSFPEYLGLEAAEKHLQYAFRYINLVLALPVLLFSALPFYESAWKSLQHKFLNIDAPIVLAIWVTFFRSVVEVFTDTGGGYFDSFSGIVFFMLIGRVLQDKTYQQLSFERDYTSYFPIAVTVLKEEKEVPTALPDIKPGDTLLIHNEELVPADGILTRGKAFIDYSFVTGESLPVLKEMGEIIYAGGKQTGGNMELLVVKEVSQSYLTKLWNKDEGKITGEKGQSFVHLLSQYFTYIVLAIALATAAYWYFNDQSRLWPAVTAILIIACPCALLLSNSFTNGNILRILSRNKLYLRNAQTIEELAMVNHIVFDKTGTLTTTRQHDIVFEGEPLNGEAIHAIAALAAQSSHPLSKGLVRHLGRNKLTVQAFREETGRGIEGFINGDLYALGSREFITGQANQTGGTRVYIAREGRCLGYFSFKNHYRNDVNHLLGELRGNYPLAVISGDNAAERMSLQQLAGKNTTLLFNQQPHDKLAFISALQENGKKVMMVGDGLNDAIAMQQANVGIAMAEDTNTFTPASDGILESTQLGKLHKFIQLCKANKQIVLASFVMSIVYNIIGLYFAVQGNLSPLIAAILMPSSSLSIILLTYGSSSAVAKWLRL